MSQINLREIMNSISESDEQILFFRLVELKLKPKFPEVRWLHSIPNQGGSGWNGKSRGMRMVKEGLKAGVHDIFLPVERYPYSGLYLEMKKRPNVSPVRGCVRRHPYSKDQEKFADFVETQCFLAFCVNGHEEAFEKLEWYLNL